jgi:hypothetical protein
LTGNTHTHTHTHTRQVDVSQSSAAYGNMPQSKHLTTDRVPFRFSCIRPVQALSACKAPAGSRNTDTSPSLLPAALVSSKRCMARWPASGSPPLSCVFTRRSGTRESFQPSFQRRSHLLDPLFPNTCLGACTLLRRILSTSKCCSCYYLRPLTSGRKQRHWSLFKHFAI